MLSETQKAAWQPYIDALPDPSQFHIEARDPIGWVRSPYYTGHDLSEAEGGEGTIKFLIRKINHIRNEITKRDLSKHEIAAIMALVSSADYHTWLNTLLTKYAHCISKKQHWEIIIACWRMMEGEEQDASATWRAIFAMRKAMPWMIEDLPPDLPKVFTVYRAGHVTGMSWSLDEGTAVWFYNRTQKQGGRAEMHQRDIRRSDILFYTNGRGEQEVVLL